MVRTKSVTRFSLSMVLFAGALLGWVANATAQTVPAPKRTIIESLDDGPGLKKSTPAESPPAQTAQGYDYSVSRELLPPLSDGSETAATAGWVTVIEARDLKTGSLPPQDTPTRLWLVGLLIVVGSAVLFRRFLQTGLAHAVSGLSFSSTAMSGLPFSRVMARAGNFGKGVRQKFASDKEPQPQWDAETESTNHQITTLLSQIEGVVARLKDGSPLRDVLNQELRLIHYRIEAAADAARIGHDTREKSAARFRGLVRELGRVQRIADSAAASVIDPTEQLAHPQSPSEAYAMLGMNPDAPPHVLKKLVDALRVTWHPDHARNESDRILREERIKQINSAWDLINSGSHI